MNFKFDSNITMYIIIGLILLYIVFIAIRSGNVIEGMEKNKSFTESITEDHVKDIKDKIKKNEDTLLIEKYKSTYEDYITEYEEYLNQMILMTLIDSAGGEDKLEKQANNLNDIYKLRDNLSTTMDFIDSKKSSSEGGFF